MLRYIQTLPIALDKHVYAVVAHARYKQTSALLLHLNLRYPCQVFIKSRRQTWLYAQNKETKEISNLKIGRNMLLDLM